MRPVTLTYAAKTVIFALKKLMLHQTGITSLLEKTRLLCMMNDAAPVALGWYREARVIYATLIGEDSVFVKQTDRLIGDVESHLKAGDLIVSCEPWLWAFRWKEYGTACAFCCLEPKEREGLSVCSGCKAHRYCSPFCQAADWKKGHKLECAVLKSVSDCFARKPHNCEPFRCPCTSVIIMKKLQRKLKANEVDEIPGWGRKSVVDILQMLPSDPKDKKSRSSDRISGTVMAYRSCLEYNVFPILRSGEKKYALGAGLFPLVPYRTMTAACWDTNVAMDFRARTLYVHANCDIPDYTGINDLRYNEFMTDKYCMPHWQRRSCFVQMYGHSCNCRKCTKEYEAEINPLLCATAGCTERIPSDERALGPCEQCGAMNSDRLKPYQQLAKKYDTLWKSWQKLNVVEYVAKKSLLLAEIDAAGVLHPDAHIRFSLGWHLAMYDFEKKNYEKGLRLLQEMIVCVRNIFSKYNCDRAMNLFHAARVVICALKKFVLDQSGVTSPAEKFRLLCILNAAAPTAYVWYKEARKILATLLGEQSVAVKHTDALTAEVETHLASDLHKIILTASRKQQ